MPPSDCELTILLPCLNEAETLAICIDKARNFLLRRQINGEVLVADNGSHDDSIRIAHNHGARVVQVKARGYGSALRGGIEAAHGRYIIMGDADDSYDFSSLDAFIDRLREGWQLVMGNRFAGGIRPGAMPLLHRYLGNPVLSALGRLFFGSPIGDFHCGLRGFEREAIRGLDLRTTGMEFASEMIVKSTLRGLRISEVPTVLHPDGRSRPPHLRTWRDGWRHLRFLLLYSPNWLFLYPGLLLVGAGLLGMGLLLPGPLHIGQVTFDVHSLLLCGMAVVVGAQAVSFSILARQFAVDAGLLPPPPRRSRFARLPLEFFLIAGFLLAVAGVAGIFYSVYLWSTASFGPLSWHLMRLLVPAVTLLAVGIQIMFAAFFRSVLSLTGVGARP
jgi:hypothetical protein